LRADGVRGFLWVELARIARVPVSAHKQMQKAGFAASRVCAWPVMAKLRRNLIGGDSVWSGVT